MKAMKKSGVLYNTNLAAEFWVLSALYRLGIDAQLTLGNKKSVDIIILRKSLKMFTVDVKGLAGRHYWPADNIKVFDNPITSIFSYHLRAISPIPWLILQSG